MDIKRNIEKKVSLRGSLIEKKNFSLPRGFPLDIEVNVFSWYTTVIKTDKRVNFNNSRPLIFSIFFIHKLFK